MMSNINSLILCKMLGGSHAYGLNTRESDFDYRGIYLTDKVGEILGLDRNEFYDSKKDGQDVFLSELRHFLRCCRKSNTQAIELLFNQKWLEVTPAWEYIQKNRLKLIDTISLFKSLKGYIQGEKRKMTLDKYGYSPKNVVQLLRLMYCGIEFFKCQIFPVNIFDYDLTFGKILLNIKTRPEDYPKNYLTSVIGSWEIELDKVFDGREQLKDLTFDLNFANEICRINYLPFLVK